MSDRQGHGTGRLNPGLVTGNTYYGFKLVRTQALPHIQARFFELVHISTGAKYIHISRNDPENTFCVLFRTPPSGSTGLTHVLEHTVLCGSRKYPLKGPFLAMTRRSLNSFMNALTAKDWTGYPFSTNNQKDFYNLMSVYLDSVFYPRLRKLHFLQEGHRLEFGQSGELERTGVVYNEMKGAYSSQLRSVADALYMSLYPGSVYGYESGGKPEEITRLRHEDLLRFHQEHYHPANAYFYSYGSFPLIDNLRFVSENALAGFDRKRPNTRIKSQKRWKRPGRFKFYYPLDKNEDPENKDYVNVAWLTCDITQIQELLALTLLSRVLLKDDSYPLHKALLDSGLGQTTGICEFENDLKDTFFTCGLRGVHARDAYKVEALVLATLTGLAEEGLPQELVEAELHRMKLGLREVSRNTFPFGFNLALQMAGQWLHSGDPIRVLDIDSELDQLEQSVRQGFYLERMIKKHLLDNPHRALVVVAPDQHLAANFEQRTKKELTAIQKRLTIPEAEQIRSQSEELQKLQSQTEDASCLPTLKLGDIASGIAWAKKRRISRGLRVYPADTSGLEYFYALVGLDALPPELLPYVPLFNRTFTEVGTRKFGYEDMLKQVNRYTGGIKLESIPHTAYQPPFGALPFTICQAKCLEENRKEMYELVKELWLDVDFSDLGRLETLLRHFKSHLEDSILPKGLNVARALAARNTSPSSHIAYLWGAVRQLQLVRDILESPGREKLKDLSEKLFAIKTQTILRDNIDCAIVGRQPGRSAREFDLYDELPEGRPAAAGFKADNASVREGYYTASMASYAGKCLKTVPMEHKDAPALEVACQLASRTFLHHEIRERGGAYGAVAQYAGRNGTVSLLSYRDPEIERTLRKFGETGRFLASGQIDEEMVKEAILRVCAKIDEPETPQEQALSCFIRDYVGISVQKLAGYKQRVLGVGHADVERVAAKYLRPETIAAGDTAVISSYEKLVQENKKLTNKLELKKI